MIRVHAMVSAPKSERGSGGNVGFSEPFAHGSLLGQAIHTLRQVREADEVYVLTDDAACLEGLDLHGASIHLLPSHFFSYGVPLFSKEHWIIARALDSLEQAGLASDVFMHLSWRAPLVSTRTMERLYHGLLEDRVAARAVAISREDPNIYTPMGHTGRLFPVWADLGQDRQRLPQLYRPAAALACHTRRMRAPIPETKGIPASSLETLMVLTQDDVELAAFALAQHSANPGPVGEPRS